MAGLQRPINAILGGGGGQGGWRAAMQWLDGCILMCSKIRDWATPGTLDRLLAPPFHLAKGHQAGAFGRAWANPRAINVALASGRCTWVAAAGGGAKHCSRFGVAQGPQPFLFGGVAHSMRNVRR